MRNRVIIVVVLAFLVFLLLKNDKQLNEETTESEWGKLPASEQRQIWARNCITQASLTSEKGIDGSVVDSCTNSAFRLYPEKAQ